MTKKDYELIADTIANQLTSIPSVDPDIREIVITRLANDLADAFKVENPRFTRDIFLSRCTVRDLNERF